MKRHFYPVKTMKYALCSLVFLVLFSLQSFAQTPIASTTSDTTCFGGPITLSVSPALGAVQWQGNTGSGWVNETGPGATDSIYVAMPTQDIDYRAYVTGPAGTDTTNILNIHVIIVPPPTNTTTDSIRCGIGTVNLSGSGSGQLLWYETPSSLEFINQGNTYSPFITQTTTYWVANTDSASGAAGGGSTVLITEINLQTPADRLEIQNVGPAPVDVTGWTVAISDSYSDINDVNTTVQTLSGTMLPGDLMVWDDVTTSAFTYWGSNMFWNPGSFPTFTGWAIILDDNGDIVDFAVWEWPTSNIQAMNTTIAGNNITIGNEWIGDGIDASTIPGGSSFNRFGSSDNNDANDWEELIDNANTTNPNIILPFPGGICESVRIPITAYASPPPAITATTSPLAVCQLDTITISMSSSNPNYIYSWNPPTFLDTILGPDVIITPNTTTTYVVTATDTSAQCVTTDTFLVDVGVIPSAGIADAPNDTVCVGATTAISATNTIGNLQWQINDGTGWVNITAPGSDSTVYSFMPSVDADYRVVATSGGCPNDTSNTVSVAVINITDPMPFDTIRCGPGPVNMHASGTGTMVWYDAPIGGELLGTGNPFTININTTDTFYVEANVGTFCNVGEKDNSIGNPSFFVSTTANWGLQFNTTQPIYLDRVHVYGGNSSGFLTVNLRDNVNGNILNTGSFPIQANVALQPLDLGWFVPQGTGFALEVQAGSIAIGYNFNGSGYPITSPGCPVTITNYFNPNPNFFDDYMYFYDWQISDGCKSSRFPAIAEVQTLPPKPQIVQNINTLSTPATANAYQWYLNGIPISGATQQTFTMTLLGDYQIEVTGPNGCTEISNILTVTIISPPGIDEGAAAIDLQVFPNPVQDILNVEFELDESADVQIALSNELGEEILVNDINKIRGKYQHKLDLRSNSNGIYMLSIKVDDASYNRKVILAR